VGNLRKKEKMLINYLKIYSCDAILLFSSPLIKDIPFSSITSTLTINMAFFNDPSDVMPFLTYLKYIRNAVAHIKSLGQINVIHLNVPTCLSDWVKILLEKFVNTSLHVI